MGKGLEGVVAATTGISCIDGQNGRLFYRGIEINELAEKSSFEETTALLWYGELPNQHQLESFDHKFKTNRQIPNGSAGADDVDAQADQRYGSAAHSCLGAFGI